jgi:alkylation response protein AidB-like acyl-CoA dehydrogenase
MTVQSATLKHVDSFRRPSVDSEKDLVARAEALIPVLRSRVEETEAGRTLTSETRRDLMESGVHRIFQPKRFGGVEGSLRAGVDILAAIGQGCSATAWVLVQNMPLVEAETIDQENRQCLAKRAETWYCFSEKPIDWGRTSRTDCFGRTRSVRIVAISSSLSRGLA